MSTKLLHGFFAGYKQQSGGGWSGFLYVYDWDQVNEATHVSQIHKRCTPAEQVYPQMTKENEFIFPLARGDLKQPGLKAAEMSRRAIARQRMQEEKEKEKKNVSIKKSKMKSSRSNEKRNMT